MLSTAFKKLAVRDTGGTKFSNYNPTLNSEMSISSSTSRAGHFHICIKLIYMEITPNIYIM